MIKFVPVVRGALVAQDNFHTPEEDILQGLTDDMVQLLVLDLLALQIGNILFNKHPNENAFRTQPQKLGKL